MPDQKKLSNESLDEVSGGYNPPPYFATCPYCNKESIFSPHELNTIPKDMGKDADGHQRTYISGMKIRFTKTNPDGTTEYSDVSLH